MNETVKVHTAMQPLVSILIPAYNAEEWISQTLESAIAQTWPRKEIIVVDDGSRDRTAELARRFTSKGVVVVSKENEGAAATRNHALRLSQGDYIQWLDADDLLAPDKIERQLLTLRENDSRRILLSSAWARFYYRTYSAKFKPTFLWQDLSPGEWLLGSMSEGLYMQTATWLTSRELTEAAGSWDTRLISDDDVEYFCRVLLASQGTRFVAESRVFYRNTPSLDRLSRIGTSDARKDAKLLSMMLQIQYAQSLEESERVRKACLKFLQNGMAHFCPERPDIVSKLQTIAAILGGRLAEFHLRRKYAWLEPFIGYKAAMASQRLLPQWKAYLLGRWDKILYKFEDRKTVARCRCDALSVSQQL
jgi:glycosyltransferase involved in cell wall biosynthesis